VQTIFELLKSCGSGAIFVIVKNVQMREKPAIHAGNLLQCFAVGLLMIEEIGKNPAPHEEELCNFNSCEFILEARLGI